MPTARTNTCNERPSSCHPSRAHSGGDATPARILLASAREEVLVHEVAHQWMGGVVGTESTRDVWLREGVPTYAEALWAEHVDGVEARDRIMASWRRRLGPTTRPPLEIDDAQNRSDDVTFLRSALALHAVREHVGDAAFFGALQMFFDRHAGTSATTDDVIKTFEEAAGEPLDALFGAWLGQEAVPDWRRRGVRSDASVPFSDCSLRKASIATLLP